METLYDLLGALPRDDAEGLRTAFRKAAKGTHPDLHPGDPDAGRKFRQIVRAHEILLDREQRAAYDHLLEIARVEAVEHARAGRIHRLASWVMAFAGVSAASVAALALTALLWSSTEPAADTNSAADRTAAINVAAMPAPASGAAAETADVILPPLAPPLDISPAPGAAELDRLHGADRAFADMSHPRHPDKGPHATSGRKKGASETSAKPASPRRTAATDLSRLETAPFTPRP